jgi:hypothetical protein
LDWRSALAGLWRNFRSLRMREDRAGLPAAADHRRAPAVRAFFGKACPRKGRGGHPVFRQKMRPLKKTRALSGHLNRKALWPAGVSPLAIATRLQFRFSRESLHRFPHIRRLGSVFPAVRSDEPGRRTHIRDYQRRTHHKYRKQGTPHKYRKQGTPDKYRKRRTPAMHQNGAPGDASSTLRRLPPAGSMTPRRVTAVSCSPPSVSEAPILDASSPSDRISFRRRAAPDRAGVTAAAVVAISRRVRCVVF